MSEAVLDASALLAYANLEPGLERVREALTAGATISTVSLAEVVTRTIERGWTEAESRSFIVQSLVVPVPFGAEDAYVAGLLRERTRHLGLSLGDRACLAVALRLGAPALTADRSWSDLDIGVEVVLVR